MILNKSFMQGFLYGKTDIGLYRLRSMSYEELLEECKKFVGFRHSLENQEFLQDPEWTRTVEEEIAKDAFDYTEEENSNDDILTIIVPKNENILCLAIRNIYEDYMCGLFPKSFDTIINAVERIRSQSEEKDNVESAWSHKFKPIDHSSDDSIWTSGNEVISCGCCEDCDCEKETSSTWEEEAEKAYIKPDKYRDIRVYEDSVLSDIIDAIINYKGINGIVEDLTETQILSITLDVIYNRKMKKYGGYVEIDDIEPAIECVSKMINIYGDGLIPVADNEPLPGYKRYDIPENSILVPMLNSVMNLIGLDKPRSEEFNIFATAVNAALNSRILSYNANDSDMISEIINELRTYFYGDIAKDGSTFIEEENIVSVKVPKHTKLAIILKEIFDDYTYGDLDKDSLCTALYSVSRTIKTNYNYGANKGKLTDYDIHTIETAINKLGSMIKTGNDCKSTLFEYSTKELTDELLTRGGIEYQWIAPESTYNIEIKNSSETVHRNIKYNGNGPLWIIFNYD